MTNKTFVILVAAALCGCAMNAPALPPDTTGSTSTRHLTAQDFSPADNALSCTQIGDQRGALQSGIDKANANIAANRHDNQVAGYFGAAFFPPALLATEGNYSDKDVIKAAYQRMDVLNQLSVLKSCRS
jgi:hypothetical protein